METKPKSYKILKTVKGSHDGIRVETFMKDDTHELSPELAEQFYHQGAVEEVSGKKNPADARETKVTGPSETKVVMPAETKDGEAGVDPDTQNIEELVATARDHYGLEVDSTMSEADVRGLIEDAQGGEDAEPEAMKDASTKKRKK